jgi:hypothetical protein
MCELLSSRRALVYAQAAAQRSNVPVIPEAVRIVMCDVARSGERPTDGPRPAMLRRRIFEASAKHAAAACI